MVDVVHLSKGGIHVELADGGQVWLSLGEFTGALLVVDVKHSRGHL